MKKTIGKLRQTKIKFLFSSLAGIPLNEITGFLTFPLLETINVISKYPLIEIIDPSRWSLRNFLDCKNFIEFKYCNLSKTVILHNEINIYDFTFINNPKASTVSKCFDIEFIFCSKLIRIPLQWRRNILTRSAKN